jgi:hypothetical protein
MSSVTLDFAPAGDGVNTVKLSKFNPANFRLSQTFEGGATSKDSTITVHKPEKHSWFTVHPDQAYHCPALVLDLKQDRETYLIGKDLRDELAMELTPKLLVPCISRQGSIFIWPVSLPTGDGPANSWTDRALEAVKEAMSGWIRLVANMDAKGYDIVRPRVQIDLPKWPSLSLEEMLEKAFGHHLIESLDHPRIRALRGEV